MKVPRQKLQTEFSPEELAARAATRRLVRVSYAYCCLSCGRMNAQPVSNSPQGRCLVCGGTLLLSPEM